MLLLRDSREDDRAAGRRTIKYQTAVPAAGDLVSDRDEAYSEAGASWHRAFGERGRRARHAEDLLPAT
ncbi:hypothetical protein D3C84_915370 [compost metagenome]